jgi:hypothetical protein
MTTPVPSKALSYTNRVGATYYLHHGKTKTGKPRYFVAKTVREGAIGEMPEGYEFSESINGVVSVRRVSTKASKIPDTDLAMVRAELARHQHLGQHRVEVVKGEIVVYELAYRLYSPVMKFVPAEEPGHYDVHRMTYRGEGGWSWSLAIGPLQKLVKKYLRHVGTEGFYELM